MALNIFKTIIIDGATVEINQNGTVIKVNGREVKSHLNKKSSKKSSPGRFYYCYINGKKFLVHRLVALAFVPNPNGYKMVVHMDTITINNYYKNLNWGCQRHIVDNMRVAQRTYQTPQSQRFSSKIPLEDIEKVVERLKNGETAASIARDYGTSDMSVIRVKKRFLSGFTPLKMVRKKTSIDDKQAIICLWRETNYTSDDIANIKGLSPSTVEKIIEQHRSSYFKIA